MRRKSFRPAPLQAGRAGERGGGAPDRSAEDALQQLLGAGLVSLAAALVTYYLFSRHGEKIKEWIPKVTITREPEIVLTDVHRNGHSKAKLGGLGRL